MLSNLRSLTLKFPKFASALFLAFVSSASVAHAGVIGFDDITYDASGDPAPIVSGYAGLTWDNLWSSRANYNPQFQSALVSGGNVAFMISETSISSISSANAFTFNGISIAKMYQSGLTRFEGYVGDTLTYTKDAFSTVGVSQEFKFDWAGVTRVNISVVDGTNRIAFDDVSINAAVAEVPEPGTFGIFGAGFALMGMVATRKKKPKA